MAWEYRILDLPAAVAGADFSGGGTTQGYNSTGQFLFVKLSADNTYVPCASKFDVPVAVSQTNPPNGDALQVRAEGVTKIMAGTNGLVAGNLVGTDANGRGVSKVIATTGQNNGEWMRGICLEAGAAGALATVYLCMFDIAGPAS